MRLETLSGNKKQSGMVEGNCGYTRDVFYNFPGLSNEHQAKLARIEPAAISQAEHLPGLTQAALMTILITMKKMEMD